MSLAISINGKKGIYFAVPSQKLEPVALSIYGRHHWVCVPFSVAAAVAAEVDGTVNVRNIYLSPWLVQCLPKGVTVASGGRVKLWGDARFDWCVSVFTKFVDFRTQPQTSNSRI